MNKVVKITDAEWFVMKTLWQKAPQTASEIIDTLKQETHWSPKTIHTLISRLVTKGAVGVNKGLQFNEFFPLVAEAEYKKSETKSFVKKVYNGSIHHLVANFIKEEPLSREEIEELKRLLNEKGQ